MEMKIPNHFLKAAQENSEEVNISVGIKKITVPFACNRTHHHRKVINSKEDEN